MWRFMRNTNQLCAGKCVTHSLSYPVVHKDIPKVVGRQKDSRVLRTRRPYRHLERAKDERLAVCPQEARLERTPLDSLEFADTVTIGAPHGVEESLNRRHILDDWSWRRVGHNGRWSSVSSHRNLRCVGLKRLE